MLDLDREIKERDKLITTQFHTHPWAKIIESMPGMGPGLGAEFLVVTGGNLTTFGSSGRLASYARLVPATRCSGRITGKLLRPNITTDACVPCSTWPPSRACAWQAHAGGAGQLAPDSESSPNGSMMRPRSARAGNRPWTRPAEWAAGLRAFGDQVPFFETGITPVTAGCARVGRSGPIGRDRWPR